jgi:hypothetical protein
MGGVSQWGGKGRKMDFEKTIRPVRKGRRLP